MLEDGKNERAEEVVVEEGLDADEEPFPEREVVGVLLVGHAQDAAPEAHGKHQMGKKYIDHASQLCVVLIGAEWLCGIHNC